MVESRVMGWCVKRRQGAGMRLPGDIMGYRKAAQGRMTLPKRLPLAASPKPPVAAGPAVADNKRREGSETSVVNGKCWGWYGPTRADAFCRTYGVIGAGSRRVGGVVMGWCGRVKRLGSVCEVGSGGRKVGGVETPGVNVFSAGLVVWKVGGVRWVMCGGGL